jgi:uncharacterized protein
MNFFAQRPVGWALLLALAVSGFFWWRLARRDARLFLVYLGALSGALIGAKLVYLFSDGWLDIRQPDVWERLATGKTIVGGLLGGYGGVELVKWAIGYPRATGDFFAVVTPLSVAVGRLGCWVNGCCLGSVCEPAAWWTMADRHGTPRWPAVPVELFFNLTAATLAFVLRRQGRFPGQLFHLYLIAYGTFRFAHEWVRDTPRFFGVVSGYQIASLGLVALGIWGFRRRRRVGQASSSILGLEVMSQQQVEGRIRNGNDASLVSFGCLGCAAAQPHRTPDGSAQTSETARMPVRGWRRWFRWIARGGAVLLVSLITACAVFYQGPYRPVEPVPQAKLIDLHCHTAGIGAGGSGCFVSKAMRDSYKFDIYLKAFGVTRTEVEAQGDALILQRISEQVGRSTNVGAAVILSMDGMVDDAGQVDTNRTEVYVPIGFVARETARYTNLLWGAGINPLRSDALERLEWAATNGAVLVKWIPSIMLIDPSDERIIPFYRRMKELGLPLLSHAGRERSFTYARDELCDPERLKLPLELGVTVIVAHIASTGEDEGEPDMERLAQMLATYPNLYSEISSLTQVNKLGYLKAALTRPEFKGRLLYGTDFPLINTALVSPWFFPLNIRPTEARRIAQIENAWDRDVALKQALGVPQEIFTGTAQLLRIPKGETTDGHR